MSEYTKKLKEEFKFIDYAPIVYVSAKNGSRLNTIFDEIEHSYVGYNQRIQTSVLNEVLTDAVKHNPPKEFNSGVLKIYYGKLHLGIKTTIFYRINFEIYLGQ